MGNETPVTHTGRAESILIVDDDPVFSDILGRAMTKRGYISLLANDIAAALALAREYRPERAVVDLKIRRESGLDLLPLLQAINPDMRMLILTGYSSISTAVAAVKLGAFDYACKPVDADQILALFDDGAEKNVSGEIIDGPLSIQRLQWEHIQKTLERNAGNISATARSLGMHRRTLQRKLQKRPVKR
ncbi:MAG: response regulator [Pseudomonadales bacterium]|nr:response regulator [Pseudomonadales bacterium]